MMLGEYLRQSACRKHEIGIWDCVVFPSDWVVICGYPDPMAEWRGGYASEDVGEDADALAGLFGDGARAAGLIETDDPQEGDVGLITLLGRHAGAICTGRRWAFVAPRGLVFASLSPDCIVKAWSVQRG